MSDKVLTSIRLREGQVEAIEEIVESSKFEEHMEDLRKSTVIRRLIDEGIDHSDLSDLVSESTRILAEREDFIERDGKVKNLRTGFEARVKQHFKRRFEQGTSEDQIREWSENMIRDARILWPEWSDEDHEERREEAVGYVEEMCEATIEALRDSSHDPLDPERVYQEYTGVEEGQEDKEIESNRDRIVSEIQEQIVELRSGPSLDPAKVPHEEAQMLRSSKKDAITWQVHEALDVPEDRVEALLDEAVDHWPGVPDQEVRADD